MKAHSEPLFELGGNVQLQSHKIPKTPEEKLLVAGGWKIEGLGGALFSHPIFGSRKMFRLQEALDTNDSVKDKCVVCGMCEDTDCCPPAGCRCLYRKRYDEMIKSGNCDDK